MYILGLCTTIHDTSACLLKNGEIVAAAEEERFIRIKHSWDRLPWFASRYCLNQEGIELDDVDYVVTAYVPRDIHDDAVIYSRKDSRNRFKDLLRRILPEHLFRCHRFPALAHVNHHMAHAASAFRCSGLQRASILVLDGRGERASTTLAFGLDNQIKVLRDFDVSQSLGILYSAVSHYVGLGGWGEGKAMGLASFGNHKERINGVSINASDYEISWPPATPLTDAESRFDDCSREIFAGWMKRLTEQFGEPNPSFWEYLSDIGQSVNRTEFPQRYCDVAASVQRDLEEISLHLSDLIVRETGCRNLVLAGGVGLNCSMNGRLARSGMVDHMFVQPAAHDGGTSIGAALELYARLGYSSKHLMRTVAYGPQFDADSILKTLHDVGIAFHECPDPAEMGARLLSEGHVIGWFQGRMEIGPRALGQRSILAHPGIGGMKDYLNSRIKHRESFRPYALSLRIEDCDEVLEHWTPSPHMLFSFKVKESWRSTLKAGVHVDGTTRPQMVIREDLPLYWQLLTRFKEMTGIPAVVNTSFNDRGEPIVCTPLDALRAFFSMSLDHLLVGRFLVSKGDTYVSLR